MLERGQIGNVYNVSGETPRTNLELTRSLTEGCGRCVETHVAHVADRPGHDRRYAVNSAKLRALGWKPQMAFDEGIAQNDRLVSGQRILVAPLKNEVRSA